MEPCLRCSSFNWGETNPTHILQAFVVAGGWGGYSRLSSVYTLISGATSWTSLASLPRALYDVRASVVGGKIRVTGGLDEQRSIRSEVMVKRAFNLANHEKNDQVLLLTRCLSIIHTVGAK